MERVSYDLLLYVIFHMILLSVILNYNGTQKDRYQTQPEMLPWLGCVPGRNHAARKTPQRLSNSFLSFPHPP